jgi:hypothetical protein
MALKAAPKIEMYNSWWESFSHASIRPSDETIRITRITQDIYILSYFKNSTNKFRYRVTSLPQSWKVEEVACSSTSFAHSHIVERVKNIKEINDEKKYWALTQIPYLLKIAEGFAALGAVFTIFFAGYEIRHRRYSPKAVPLLSVGILLVICMIFSRNVFRRNIAFKNALKLIIVADHARQNKSSIEEWDANLGAIKALTAWSSEP